MPFESEGRNNYGEYSVQEIDHACPEGIGSVDHG